MLARFRNRREDFFFFRFSSGMKSTLLNDVKEFTKARVTLLIRIEEADISPIHLYRDEDEDEIVGK